MASPTTQTHPSLLNLPPEILTRVVSLLPAHRYAAHPLLYTCQHIYNIVLPLSVHTFWDVQHEGEWTWSPQQRKHILLFFRYITLAKPWLAQHVRTIKGGIREVDAISRYDDEGQHEGYRVVRRYRSQQGLLWDELDIADNLLTAAGIEGISEKAMWKQGISQGSSDAELALLIISCPNLSDLCISGKLGPHVIQLLFEARGGSCLQHLRSYYQEQLTNPCGHQNWNWEAAKVFRLPHIKSFESIRANAKVANAFEEVPPRSSGVEHICFRKSKLPVEFIGRFFLSFRQLRSFEYTNCGSFLDTFDSALPEVKPHEALQALMPHAESLEYLHLNFRAQYTADWKFKYPNREIYIGTDLARFTKLKTLQIGQPVIEGLGRLYRVEGLPGASEPLPSEITGTLVELFPESLESLTVHSCSEGIIPQAQQLLSVINTGERFRNLRYICFLFEAEADYSGKHPSDHLECTKADVRLSIQIQSRRRRDEAVLEIKRKTGVGLPYPTRCSRIRGVAGEREEWLRLRNEGSSDSHQG